MHYLTPNVVVDYAYNHRKWLDTLVATRGGTNIFRQILRYDSTGQITQQRWRQGSGVYDSLLYGYDAVQRLIGWGGPTSLTERDYTYDSVGNRLTNVVPDALSGLLTTTYAYGTTSTGPNRLLSTITKDTLNTTLGSRLFTYDPDGAMTARRLRDGLGTVLRTDALQYSYRGLTRRFVWDVGGMEELDWRYRYSASGEREQKRLYSGPGPDGEGWVYYLLTGRTQHAVYHGMQTVACEIPTTMVYISPVEYLGYGGGEGLVRYDPTGVRTYTVSDHLGSLRALVNDTGTVIRSVDYEPFGDVYAENGQATRREFLNLERDRESELGDHGVRKYDAELGRFISVDPLWEKYAGFSPYQYGANSPLRIVDADGRKLQIDPKDRDAWDQAIAYLRQFKSSNTDAILRDLEESPNLYLVRITGTLSGVNEENSFTSFLSSAGYGIIEWDVGLRNLLQHFRDGVTHELTG